MDSGIQWDDEEEERAPAGGIQWEPGPATALVDDEFSAPATSQAGPPTRRTSAVEAGATSFGQGASFGFSDELAGAFGAFEEARRRALSAVGLPYIGTASAADKGKPLVQVYREGQKFAEGRQKAGVEEHPEVAIPAEVAGGLAVPLPGAGGAGAGRAATAGGRALQAVKQGAKAGAIGGAISGAGTAEGGSGLAGTLKGAAGGAAMGAGLGGLMGGAFQGGAEALGALGAKARGVAGRALNELAPELQRKFVQATEDFVRPGKEYYQDLLKRTREGLKFKRSQQEVADENVRRMQGVRARYEEGERRLRERAAKKTVAGDVKARADAAKREDHIVGELRRELLRQQKGEDRSKEIAALLEESRAIREAAPKKAAQEVSTYTGQRRNRADYLRGAGGMDDLPGDQRSFLDAMDAFNREKFAEEAAQGFDPAAVMSKATDRELGRAAGLEAKAQEMASRPGRTTEQLISELVSGAKGPQAEDELSRAIRAALRRDGVTKDPAGLPLRSFDDAMADAEQTVHGGSAKLPALLPKPQGPEPFLPPAAKPAPRPKFVDETLERLPTDQPIPGGEPWAATPPEWAPKHETPQQPAARATGVESPAAKRRGGRAGTPKSPADRPPVDELPPEWASDELIASMGWPQRLRPELRPPEPTLPRTPVSRFDIEAQALQGGRQALKDQALGSAMDALLNKNLTSALARGTGLGVARELQKNPAARAAAFGDVAKVLERVPGSAQKYGPILDQAAARGANALNATWHSLLQRDEALRTAAQENGVEL